MSWQEGLRELDEALASGRISADEYRVRRDKLLTSAVTPGDETERTQQVGRWQANHPGTTPGSTAADGEETQVVPGVPTQSGLGGQPPRPAPGGYPGQYGSPPWDQDQSPPWGGQEFPPLAPTTSPDWIRQGPEVFAPETGSKGGRVLLLTALIVVLVAGLGVGAYFMFFAGGGQEQAGPGTTGGQTTTAPTTTQPPKDDLSTAELPGKTEDHSGITTFADAAASNFLTDDEIAIYQEAGAGKSRLVASTTDDEVHTLIFTTQASSADAAETASGKLAEQQIVYGMTEYADAPANVEVGEFPGNDTTPATIRAHYQFRETIVRIQVNGAELDAVTAVFEDLVTAQLEVLDAND
ncbi:flagellar basal body protein FliL [Actinophytocola gossypii]|uniref:Flagellar basal body protein FliL n=1 Tax=Actinophytocola gossypii TaxID=2812003 RepID=A0ABT2J1W6_9PSEU|nr:flagellar basal body protein FliL [Actinophytocola gossypii]MCT2581857.1 flagellar basal body protein FliL [Actinophytocola gossypii]